MRFASDPVAAAALRDDLATMASREGVTVFLTTHNLAEAERLCQQVAVIRAGRLLAVDAPDELRAGARGPRVDIVGTGFSPGVVETLGRETDVTGVDVGQGRIVVHLTRARPIAPLVRLVVTAGAEVEEVSKDRASLEEAFLDPGQGPAMTDVLTVAWKEWKEYLTQGGGRRGPLSLLIVVAVAGVSCPGASLASGWIRLCRCSWPRTCR